MHINGPPTQMGMGRMGSALDTTTGTMGPDVNPPPALSTSLLKVAGVVALLFLLKGR
jgi:hypothetical protein